MKEEVTICSRVNAGAHWCSTEALCNSLGPERTRLGVGAREELLHEGGGHNFQPLRRTR